MNKAVLFLLFLGAIILGLATYIFYPMKGRYYNGVVQEYDGKQDVYRVTDDKYPCSDPQLFGYWCYIECVGSKNPLYYMCKTNGEKIMFSYHGQPVTALCPKSGNSFDSDCSITALN